MSDAEHLAAAHEISAAVANALISAGCDRTFLAHGLMAEAMKALLGVDDKRAADMARGFVALAAIDQKNYIADKANRTIDFVIRNGGRTGDIAWQYDAAKHLLKGSTSIPISFRKTD